MPADEQYVEGPSLSGGTVEFINQKKTSVKRKLIVRTIKKYIKKLSN